jgi:hypothetical protein
MTAWLIILFGLWLYPIISFIVIWKTRNRPILRKRIFYISVVCTVFTLLGVWANISTTSSELDWLMISNLYFTISLILSWMVFEPNKYLKIIGYILMCCIYGEVYISSTLGAVGIGFVIHDYSTDTEIWLEKDLIYKDILIGNAIAKVRGKRVEIYKTLPYLPIIEWRKQTKEYFGFTTYMNKINVDYKATENKLYLSISSKDWGRWNDTLYVK